MFCNITQEILALPSLSSSEPCQSAVAWCHGTMSKPSLVAPVGSCMGSCFMSCVCWRGSKGRRRERFMYLLPKFFLWGSHGGNCKTASRIINSIKDVTRYNNGGHASPLSGLADYERFLLQGICCNWRFGGSSCRILVGYKWCVLSLLCKLMFPFSYYPELNRI